MLKEPNKRRALAIALGALANVSRLDTVLPLPRGVHWTVAGASGTVLLDWEDSAYDTVALDGVLGYMGGWLLSYSRVAVPTIRRLLAP
jgi:hypothetical protein